MIYQGLSTTDLKHLRVDDVKLREGFVRINGSPRINERKIPLNPNQILDIQEYIFCHRTKLSKDNDNAEDYLIISSFGGANGMTNLLAKLLGQAKKIHPNLQNMNQLRTCCIQRWLTQYGLRKAQYLAGHRYVSSTEKYQKNDIEALQNDIEKFGLSLEQ